MLRYILASLSLLGLISAGPLPTSVEAPGSYAAGPSKLIKAFDAWIKLYRSGKINMRDPRDRSKKSMGIKLGVLGGTVLGAVTAERELQLLLDAAVKEGSAAAIMRVLKIAGTGLDHHSYSYEHAPLMVRSMGERSIRRASSPEAKDQILQAARGEFKADSGRDARDAAQAAALRALGWLDEQAFRPALEQGLLLPEPFLRLAAADGLRAMKSTASIEALATALGSEKDDAAIIGITLAMQDIAEAGHKSIDAVLMNRSIEAITGALGRSSWRADVTLVSFLESFRAAEAVPALIDLLDHFVKKPDLITSGKSSGVLRMRVYEALVSLSGAFFPRDRTDQWREWWQSNKDSFQIATLKNQKSKGPGTVAEGFFGIPVKGARVVFIIDISGSMIQPYSAGRTVAGGRRPSGGTTRLDIAKRELLKAIDALPTASKFNIVLFSERIKTWNSKLVSASGTNKRRSATFIKKLRAEGNTNLWGAMQEGLKIKSLVYGDRYDSNVDEVFILSDGAPTVGNIINTKEVLDSISETNRFSGVRINTVFIGMDPANSGQRRPGPGGPMRGGPNRGMPPSEMMQKIAENNGGEFVQPNSTGR